jgi:hypothetical protein
METRYLYWILTGPSFAVWEVETKANAGQREGLKLSPTDSLDVSDDRGGGGGFLLLEDRV